MTHKNRNPINNHYGNRGKPTFTRYNNDSSSDDSSDTESDVTSSESSDEDYKTRVFKGGNYGKLNNKLLNRNGAKADGRSASAKINDKTRRGIHTQRNLGSPGGSMTGRSVKSESAINATLSKRRLENGKPPLPKETKTNVNIGKKKEAFTNSIKNTRVKAAGNTDNLNVTHDEKDRVLKKYGLSPLSAPESKTKRKKAGQRQYDPRSMSKVNNGVENGNGEIKSVQSDSAIASGYFMEDIVKETGETNGGSDLVAETETSTQENSGENIECNKTKTDNTSAEDETSKNQEAVEKEESNKRTAWHVEQDSTDKILHLIDCLDNKDKSQMLVPPDYPSSEVSDTGSVNESKSKTLTDKAAKSFRKYANLTPPNRIVGKFGKKENGKGYRITLKDKPFSAKKPSVRKSDLKTVNPVPYGYARRQANKVKGVGPFHRINVRALNSSIDYKLEDAFRSGSADIPKMSYRHKVDTPRRIDPKLVLGIKANSVSSQGTSDLPKGEDR